MVSEQTEARSVWSLDDVKAHIDEVIGLIEQGQTATITKDGLVMAELRPAPSIDLTAEERQAAVAKFHEERAKWAPLKATREELMTWRHEGLRR